MAKKAQRKQQKQANRRKDIKRRRNNRRAHNTSDSFFPGVTPGQMMGVMASVAMLRDMEQAVSDGSR